MPNLEILFPATGTLIGLGAYVYTWLTYRHAANSESISELSNRVAYLEGVAKTTEGAWAAMAKGQHDVKEELSKVHKRVDETAKSTSNVQGQLTQIGRSVEMLVKNNLKE